MFLTVLIALSLTALWAYEAYTQNFKLSRIERQIALLEKVSAPALAQGTQANPALRALSASLVRQLQETDVTLPTSLELPTWAKKSLAAAAAWLAFGLFVALIPNNYTVTQPASGSVVAGMTVVASPFIALAAAMPTNPWINYVLYPIGHIVLLGALLSWLSFAVRRRYLRQQRGKSDA